MKIYDYSNKNAAFADSAVFPDSGKASEDLFVLCRAGEVPVLQAVFGWDANTVLDCTDLDESVRYTSYDGYDFISLVHMEIEREDFVLREINLYISSHYLALVMPEHESARVSSIETAILKAASGSDESGVKRAARLYFLLFHMILTDFSDMLESLEDKMEALIEAITRDAHENQLSEIGRLRQMSYTAKKQLRALSYLGAQILMDENRLLSKKDLRYFHNVDTRFKKLYDFAENLYELSNELLYTYDSKLTMRMNDTVNKLTLITLFFGPLTVITGIYGMNFDWMPELRMPFGYPMVLGVMVAVSFVMYVILKKKKWL
jgi:magnesium transporter